MGLMQLLGTLQVNPKRSTPKTFLLSRVQVKKAKWEQAKSSPYTHGQGHEGRGELNGKKKTIL